MAQSQIEREALSQELARVRFSQLYRAEAAAILAYALRRAPDREDAADAAAETFLVAWRVLANQDRAQRRRGRLGERLAEALRTELATHDELTGEGAELMQAMAKLGEEDRELLLLISWEGLSPGEAAKVIGISSLAARSRLHRARRRLRAVVEEGDDPARRNSELDVEGAR
jgi:RNA polymerase sigma-70 factor (ECF subfamily)